MKAIVCPKYGPPDVLELQEVDKPPLEDNRVLVRVKAASINPVDRHLIRGGFLVRLMGEGLTRPKRRIRGADLAGRVEAVGRNVTQFQPGDEVFGTGPGAYAEYVCAREDRVVRKPSRITFEQAAAIPIAGITALQALRDWGRIQPGQKVLINGASGGVGTFAVQIAKSYGAEVTAVCSTRNVEQAKSLGADRVIDYTREDFAQNGEHYDLILDNAGNRSLSILRRALVPRGTLVLNAGPRGGDTFIGFIFGFAGRLLMGLLLSKITPKKVAFHMATINKNDLNILRELVETGKVVPTIDRSYPLGQVPDAIRYWEEGHARAKIVISV